MQNPKYTMLFSFWLLLLMPHKLLSTKEEKRKMKYDHKYDMISNDI